MESPNIRPLRDDYAALARLYAEVYPNRIFSPERLREAEEGFPKSVFRKFSVAERAGEVVAACVVTQDQAYSLPGDYFCNVWVQTKWRRQGIGATLFDHLLNQISALKPARLSCSVSENSEAGIHFLEQRDFRESHRSFESRMELSRFRAEAYPLPPQLAERGIVLRKLTELQDPLHREKIYALQASLEREVPGAEQRRMLSFEEFWAKTERDMPGGDFFCVALHGEKYVGIHFASRAPGSEWFMIRVTGVDPAYKKLGIATALKARGLAYAKSAGFPGAFTWNDSRNRAILALNEKFGFQRQPASVTLTREF